MSGVVDAMPITRMQRRNSQFQRKVSIRIGMYECECVLGDIISIGNDGLLLLRAGEELRCVCHISGWLMTGRQ
jgi:hypothetical protein